MPGIIQSAQSSPIKDPTLNKLAQSVEGKVSAALRPQLMATIVSGMQVMFSQQTAGMLKQRLSAADPDQTVPQGIAQLMALIYKESGRKMDIRIVAPAAIVLMCHALDFGEQTGITQPMNAQQVAQLAQDTAMAVLKVFGIGQPQIDAAVQRGQGAQNGNA